MRHGPRNYFRIEPAPNGDTNLYEFGHPGWILVDTFASPQALARFIRRRWSRRTAAGRLA
ncbi:MAG: hypothetical protein ACRC67_26150 [Inquilinus sp.]|uniref:hypothetical protein n=1 Tax=Inquilinus sp. TaxID=1932117 RepID=UPI003F3FF609